MKNQRDFLQTMKQHGRGIATVTLLAGTLILPWTAAQAEPSASANFSRDESNNLSVGAPGEQMNLAMLSRVDIPMVNTSTYPAKATEAAAVQLFSDTAMDDFQTHAFAPTFLPYQAPNSVNQQKPGLAANDDGSWVMFSW